MSTPQSIDWCDRFRSGAESFAGQLLWDEPIAKYTYYKIGGQARLMAAPKNVSDLEWLSTRLAETGVPYLLFGLASNLLVSDQGYDGVLIRASRLDTSIAVLPSPPSAVAHTGVVIRTGSGVAVSTLLGRAAREGWGGLEFLAGVPGSVGGVVTMNAGTSTGEAKDRLLGVHVYDLAQSGDAPGGLRYYKIEELQYVYRENQTLTPSQFILSADWRVEPDAPLKIKARIDALLEKRKNAQPVDYPSCGSVFRNPSKTLSAWQVIERLGLKGHRLGDAQFSEKHANFIINHGNARSSDVHRLIETAKERAKNELGVTLREEVIRVGRFDPVA